MRHRLRLSLYDEYRVDAEVLDYLESLPDAHRATFLQNLVRVGFQVLMNGVEVQAAYQQACLPDLKTQEPRKAVPAPVPHIPPVPAAIPVPARPAPAPEPLAPAPAEPFATEPVPIDAPAPVTLFAEEAPPTDSAAELLDADPAIDMAGDAEPLHDEPLMPDPVVPAGGGMDVMARMRAKAQGRN